MTSSHCPIGASLEILGEKWTLLIIRDLFRGKQRFNDLEQSVGCPRSLLSTRLKKLQQVGIIVAEPYQEPGQRARTAYHLSPSGQALLPILGALQEWALTHLPADTTPTMTAINTTCASPARVGLTCAAGHVVDPAEVSIRPVA